ncbi:MAG: TetR/AcrR family transcriptional regulator [Sphingomonas paucimobilis]
MNLLQCGEACRASRAAARREKLVSVARRLFAEQGFHGTGVAQLAAESGIKVGQIYRDFADKEAIVAEIVESDLAIFLNDQDMTRAIETRDVPALREWLREFLRCGSDGEPDPLFAEIMAEAARNDRIRTIAHSINRSVSGALMRVVTALVPADSKAEARNQLCDMILTMSAGVLYRRIGDPDFEEAATFRRLIAVLDAHIDALIAPKPDPIFENSHCGFVTTQ